MAPVDALRNKDTGEEGQSPRKIATGALFPLWGDGELLSADYRTENRPAHSLVSIRSLEQVARNMSRTSLPIRSMSPLDQGVWREGEVMRYAQSLCDEANGLILEVRPTV